MDPQTTSSGFSLSCERLKIINLLVVVVSCIAIWTITHQSLVADPDIWWHIKTGAWIWQHGSVPTTDPFSFTFAGHPWIAKEWLSQLIYAATFSAGGWSLIAVLGTVIIAISVALLYQSAFRSIKPSIAAILALLCILLTSSAITARPHLLTLPLVILWTDQLFRSSLRQEGPNYLLLVLLVVWANLHAAFTMGFVIAFFAFLDFLENARFTKRRELIGWVLFLALCPVVTLLHPYTYQPMLTTLKIVELSDIGVQISEWQPFNAQVDYVYAIALLAMVFGALTSGFRLGMARSALILLLTYLFMAHMRYAFFLFPVLALLVAPILARQFPGLSTNRWREQPLDPFETRLSGAFRPVAFSLLSIMLLALGLQLFAIRTEPPQETAATAAIDFLKAHRGNGNVMNHYNFGGPLIFAGIPTFVDGRSEQLFTGEFAKDATANPRKDDSLAKTLDKYKIDWTLLPPGDSRNEVLAKLPGWNKMFSDKYAVIYQRQQASR